MVVWTNGIEGVCDCCGSQRLLWVRGTGAVGLDLIAAVRGTITFIYDYYLLLWAKRIKKSDDRVTKLN